MVWMQRHGIDPENISREDMRALARIISDYLDALDDVIVIPEEIQREYGDRIERSRKDCRKLIKKLNAGDTSVFNDEWDSTLLD